MLTIRDICSVLFVIVRFAFTTSIISNSKFIVVKDRKNVANVYRDVVSDSIRKCAAFCQRSDECTAANYNKNTMICSLVNMASSATEYALGWELLLEPKGKTVLGNCSFIAERTFLHITNRSEDWDGAKSYCESIGGDLANINTQSDHQIILDILNPAHDTNVWIGGSDRVNEGDWIWSNGCRFSDQGFNFWKSNEPSNNNQDQHCLEIMNSEWNDDYCSTTQTFVCEMDVVA